MSPKTLPFVAVAAFAVASAAQSPLVIPSAAAAVDGNSSTSYPFDVANGRFLYVYDSTHFTANGVNFPILITQIAWRANASNATWSGATPTMQLDLSTAPVDYAAISTTWDNNHGLDRATVYNGAFPIAAGSSVTGTPGPFYAVATFSQPFLYDPASGDLTIDTTVLGNTTANTPILDAVTTVGVANAKRVYSVANPPAAVATLWSGDLANVLEFTFTPASGLYAGFSTNVTTGNSPLAVQFTDSSFSSAPGGIAAWAWDFDGDNVIDSTLQNPLHTYTQCGTYTVSLTVIDGVHPNTTETKVGHIVVDPITASFTASTTGGFAPQIVQFTDTSTGPISAWLWDLDGDTLPDSTLQNPTFAYANPGTYSVTLTVTNACRNVSLTRNNLITILAPGTLPAQPEVIQYQFNEVRGQGVANTASTNAAPALGTFSVANWQSDPGRAGFRGNEAGFGCIGYRATGAGGVNSGWPINISGSFSVSFWLRRDPASTTTNPFGYTFGDGTFRSFVAGAAGQGITFRGSAIGNVDSGFPVINTPGVWQHLTLVVDDAAGTAQWFDNGTPSATVVNFTPNTFAYSSANTLKVGAYGSASPSSPVTTHFDFDDFRLYSRALLPAEVLINALSSEHASAGAAGSSCAGPGGTPVISGVGVPAVGNLSFALSLGNAENGRLAASVVGFTPVAAGLFDLSPWLGAGCEMQTDVVAFNFVIVTNGGWTQPLGIPQDNSFAGLHLYAQWLVHGTQGAATQLLDINIQQ